MKTPGTVLETLEVVDAFFDKPERWLQHNGVAYDHLDRVIACCMLGAIQQVVTGFQTLPVIGDFAILFHATSDVIKRQLPHHFGGVAQFNDARDTTFEDVKRIIGYAIEREKVTPTKVPIHA